MAWAAHGAAQLDPVEAAALEPEVADVPDGPGGTPTAPALGAHRRLIDAIAVFTLEAPISGELALQHQPPSHRAGNKPLQIEGLNAETGEWELPRPASATASSRPASRWPTERARSTKSSTPEFVQKLQAFADAIQADAQFPDMLEVVAHARELDQFAAAHDAQLALLLRAKSTAWTPGFMHHDGTPRLRVASCRGLVLPSPGRGAPPILTLNFDPRPRWPKNLRPVPARTTLALDVPGRPPSKSPLPPGRDSARLLARDLEADMCDGDRGHRWACTPCRHRHRGWKSSTRLWRRATRRRLGRWRLFSWSL